jgi:hypothetical protein
MRDPDVRLQRSIRLRKHTNTSIELDDRYGNKDERMKLTESPLGNKLRSVFSTSLIVSESNADVGSIRATKKK